MIWIVVKFVLKLGTVVAPFLVVPLIATHCHDTSWIRELFGTGEDKAKVEKMVSASFSTFNLVCIAIYESYAHLWPRVQSKRFASSYVNNVIDAFAKSIEPHGLRLGYDLRVNVLFAKRCWILLLTRFAWFANRGFLGGHHDDEMWMLTLQGLCGRAFRRKETLAVDLRNVSPSTKWWPSAENLWLFRWQRKKTRHLKAILSIPLFRRTETEAMTHHKVVGVVNVDAVSDKGAEWLLKNAKTLEFFFGDKGTTLVWLSVR